MKCDFVVGDKVVCIRDFDETRAYPEEELPIINEIYTIREINVNDNGIWIKLVEIVNPIMDYDDFAGECDFTYEGFRKVQKHKTDISIFKSMLNKSPEENNKELVESQVKDMIDA